MRKVKILLILLLLVAGCQRKPLPPSDFQIGDKVCYVDEPTLTGRVIRIFWSDRKKHYSYKVQWLASGERTSFWGGEIGQNPFTFHWHLKWELVLIEDSS